MDFRYGFAPACSLPSQRNHFNFRSAEGAEGAGGGGRRSSGRAGGRRSGGSSRSSPSLSLPSPLSESDSPSGSASSSSSASPAGPSAGPSGPAGGNRGRTTTRFSRLLGFRYRFLVSNRLRQGDVEMYGNAHPFCSSGIKPKRANESMSQ